MLGRTVASAAGAHPLLLLLARPVGRRCVRDSLHLVSRLQYLRHSSSYPALCQASRHQPDSSTACDTQQRGADGGGAGGRDAAHGNHRLATYLNSKTTTATVDNVLSKVPTKNVAHITADDPSVVATDVRNIAANDRHDPNDSIIEHRVQFSAMDCSKSSADHRSDGQDSTSTRASPNMASRELTEPSGPPVVVATSFSNQDGVYNKEGGGDKYGLGNASKFETVATPIDSTGNSPSLPPAFSSSSSSPGDGTKSKPALTSVLAAQEPKPKGVLGYMITRYTWYIDRLQQSLENEMPRTFKMFRIFNVGIKAFAKDFVGLVRVLVKLSFPTQRLESLSLQQLELYHFMPWDMVKVFPVLAVSAVPFGQNVALPFGYLFPRQLLCRHFWDLQQNHDFSMRQLQRQTYYARPVFRSVQASVESIKELGARVRTQSACHLLGSGVHPSTSQVLALRPLFQDQPYSLSSIKRHHVKSLLRLHGLSGVMGGRRRLRDHARWLRCHDIALLAPPNDGDTTPTGATTTTTVADDTTVHPKTADASMAEAVALHHVSCLKTALLLRGISPLGLDSSAMVELLLRWLAVSTQLQPQDASLLLHLPVMLFYNYPANMALRSY